MVVCACLILTTAIVSVIAIVLGCVVPFVADRLRQWRHPYPLTTEHYSQVGLPDSETDERDRRGFRSPVRVVARGVKIEEAARAREQGVGFYLSWCGSCR